MLLSHLCDRGFVRELQHEELDFERGKDFYFINFIIKEFIFLFNLLPFYYGRCTFYMVMQSQSVT